MAVICRLTAAGMRFLRSTGEAKRERESIRNGGGGK
jgi:hypothetical protein